jgi:hypothetical protein
MPKFHQIVSLYRFFANSSTRYQVFNIWIDAAGEGLGLGNLGAVTLEVTRGIALKYLVDIIPER